MSEQGRKLTEQHRRRQLAVRAAASRQLLSVWRTEFDVDDIPGSSVRFARTAIPLIEEGKRRSAELAADYFSTFRQTDGPGPLRARPVIDVNERRVQTSLGWASKIVPLKAIRNGATPTQAARAGLQQSIGTTARFVSEGSRQTITNAVREDPARPSFQRVTGPNPCEFCAMLSARGGVYRTESSAVFEAHAGRGAACQCEPEAVYGSRYLSPQQRRFKELYDREAKGTSDPLKSFRAAYRREFKP